VTVVNDTVEITACWKREDCADRMGEDRLPNDKKKTKTMEKVERKFYGWCSH
jgi:hypothetical protein